MRGSCRSASANVPWRFGFPDCERGNISYHAAKAARDAIDGDEELTRVFREIIARRVLHHEGEERRVECRARAIGHGERGVAKRLRRLRQRCARRAILAGARGAFENRSAFEQLQGDVLSRRDFFLQSRAPRPENVGPRFDSEPPLTDAIERERTRPPVRVLVVRHCARTTTHPRRGCDSGRAPRAGRDRP